ncbi:ankyrin repeat-containing domain protein [Trichoderma aethiopicum]
MSSVLPVELLLIIAESLNAGDLHALVRGIPSLAGELTYTRHLLAVPDEDGDTLVHLLARNGEDDSLGLMFPENGIGEAPSNDILRQRQALLTSSANFKGATPLLLAAEGGHMAVVERILRCPGVDLDHVDIDGHTAVDWAARKGHTEIVSLLLERPELTVDWNTVDRRVNPLCLAVEYGHEETARRILERHAGRISVNSRTAIGRTPLCHAILRGWDALVALILEHPEVDVNQPVDFAATALHLAVRTRNNTAMKAILAHPNVDPNRQDVMQQTALHEAVYLADQTMLRLLLADPRVEVNIANGYGASPLVNAVKKGYEFAVRLVLERPDILPDKKDGVGMTALAWATHLGRLGVVEMLLDRQDVDPNARDDDGVTPLSIAVQRGCCEVAKLLLSAPSINVNDEDDWGWTALAHARFSQPAFGGPSVSLLLSHGATMTLYPEMTVSMETLSDAEMALDIVQSMVEDHDIERYMIRRFGREKTELAFAHGENGVRSLLFRQTRAAARRNVGHLGNSLLW